MTQQRLHEKFEYRSGRLIRKRIGRGSGKKTGRVKNTGYHSIKIDGSEYYLHRLIWLWHHGRFPVEIDHIDRDKSNNAIENLREVTRSENQKNRNDFKWCATAQIRELPGGGFSAYATVKSKGISQKYLGSFDTYGEALRERIIFMRENSAGEGWA